MQDNLDYLESGYKYPVFAEPTVKKLLNKINTFYTKKVVWLIQYEANIVGIFALGNFPETINGKGNWYETVIYVHPDYRNLGIAKALTLNAAKSIEKKPWFNLLVEVRTDNIPSTASHTKIFPNIEPVLVHYETFSARQWRVPENYTIENSNRWLSEEIGIGMVPFHKNN